MSDFDDQNDTVQVVGIKADGSRHVLGTATMPTRMKARELVREQFGDFDEDDASPAADAFYVCERLIEWMEIR